MSFTKVIKAPNAQQCIGSFVACYQQSYFQPQNPASPHPNDLSQGNFEKKNKLNLKKSMFWHNDIPSTFAYHYLLQNISSLNSLSNDQKHDYSQFQSNEFIHVLRIQQDQITSGISQTQTVQSQYISSAKTSNETISDVQSLFQFELEMQQIPETEDNSPKQ